MVPLARRSVWLRVESTPPDPERIRLDEETVPKTVGPHGLVSSSLTRSVCLSLKEVVMQKCRDADRYDGLHPPRCDGGRGCEACRIKYQGRLRALARLRARRTA